MVLILSQEFEHQITKVKQWNVTDLISGLGFNIIEINDHPIYEVYFVQGESERYMFTHKNFDDIPKILQNLTTQNATKEQHTIIDINTCIMPEISQDISYDDCWDFACQKLTDIGYGDLVNLMEDLALKESQKFCENIANGSIDVNELLNDESSQDGE